MKVSQFLFNSRRGEYFTLTGLLLLLVAFVMLWPQNSAGQHPAVPKLTLAQVEELVSHKVPDSTLSTQIQRRGLAFAPNPTILESLRAKGAGPLTLAVVEELFPKGTRSIVGVSRTQITLASGFTGPSGVAVDEDGNVFVSDYHLEMREILAEGGYITVRTLCGGRNIMGVAAGGSSHIFLVGPGVREGGEEVLAGPGCTFVKDLPRKSGFAVSVAVDTIGNVFIADNGIPRDGIVGGVRKIPAGCSSASCEHSIGGGFNSPWGVAVDRNGDVFVADTGNNAVKKIPPGCLSASCVQSLGGGFNRPMGVAVDGSGTVFVADTDNKVVKEIPRGCAIASCIRTVGEGFDSPWAIAVDGKGNVFVVDRDKHSVVELKVAGSNVIQSVVSQPAHSGGLPQTDPARPVSILTVSNLFDYNARKMDEWQPLLQMLKETNATITEANNSMNPEDFDIIFWDACREDNSLLFPRIQNLIRNGKIIILTGTNSCKAGSNSRFSSQIANDVLRNFGLELSMDDPSDVLAYSTSRHAIMTGVSSFLTFRSPSIKITNPSVVTPLAINGENVMLAAYEDRVSKGLLIATGEGEGFLFGAYDQSSKTHDHKELLILRNIISYARSISAKSKESMSDRAESATSGPSLAATMQFIQDKLNGLGKLTYVQTFQTPSGHTFSNTFTVEASNVVADQSQCRISYHLKRNMDSPTPQVLTDGDQLLSLHDAKDVGVKSYAQYLTEQNSIHGPHLVILSTAPPLSALVIHPAAGKDTIFPLIDDVLAGRVAKALDHAVTLCGGSKKEPF